MTATDCSIWGAWRTGKFTDDAMKQRLAASACSCVARSTIVASATVTIGRKVTSSKWPPSSSSSTIVPIAESE
jgi:hypothetical protein